MQELNQTLPRLLEDVLKEPFFYDPIVFAKSSRTTDVFASTAKEKIDALAAIEPKLTHIVPCVDLVRQLTPDLTKALDGIWVQPGDRLSMRVHSKYTMVPLPRGLHSEKDSEDIFLALYLHPALSLLGFLKAKEKLKKEDPSMAHTFDQIMHHKELQNSDFYAASLSGANHIADIGVYELCPGNKAFLHLPIEIKTPVAFPRRQFSQISPRISFAAPVRKRGPHDIITETDMKKIEGWAIQFTWPERGQNLGDTAEPKLNKILTQVWNQMVAEKKIFAILSCNDVHYCLYRKDVKSGHLYISPPYLPVEDGLMEIVTWILKAAGYIKRQIKLPAVYDWWEDAMARKGIVRPGVNDATFPREALKFYNSKLKLKSKNRK